MTYVLFHGLEDLSGQRGFKLFLTSSKSSKHSLERLKKYDKWYELWGKDSPIDSRK